MFFSLDRNSDGTISRGELYEAYKAQRGKKYAAEKTDAIFKKVDLNRNGLLDFTEFCIANMDL